MPSYSSATQSMQSGARLMSMSFDVQPSVRALRAEAETNRARLTGTVEELRTTPRPAIVLRFRRSGR